MTLNEAIEQRIPRVRLPEWQTGYLRLPLLAGGQCGPWAEYYRDIPTIMDAGPDSHEVKSILASGTYRPGVQKLMVTTETDDRFERYDGVISVHETDPRNFARKYVES